MDFRSRLHKLKNSNTVVAEYSAPINLSPAFFGTMLDNRLKMKEVAATILMLHLKKIIQIEYDKQTSSFQIRLLSNQINDLNRHEQYIISVITPHLYNGVIKASNIGDAFRTSMGTFIFVVEQDLQIAGYYMFNSKMNTITPAAFAGATFKAAFIKGMIKPWNWPGFILSLFFPVYGIIWIVIAYMFYNRLGIYNYKTKKWEEIWPEIEGYYNYLVVAEKQPRNFDLTINPELFNISVHDPYLVAAQLESNWMKIFDLGIEVNAGSNSDYKTG